LNPTTVRTGWFGMDIAADLPAVSGERVLQPQGSIPVGIGRGGGEKGAGQGGFSKRWAAALGGGAREAVVLRVQLLLQALCNGSAYECLYNTHPHPERERGGGGEGRGFTHSASG
jgi:hypothetical protein